MTAELVAKLGAVDYRGDRPCLPQHAMAKLALAIDSPRRRLMGRVLELISKSDKQKHEQNPSLRAS